MRKLTVFVLTLLAGCGMTAFADTMPAEGGTLPFAAAVKEDGKWGVAGADGRLIIPAVYDAAAVSLSDKELYGEDIKSMPGRDRLIEVRDGRLRGFYDREGRVVVPVSYEKRSSWTNNALAVQNREGKIAFYRKDGKKLSDFIYDEASDFEDGVALVKKNGKYGYLRMDGSEIAPVYQAAGTFSGGAAPVKNKKWGVINEKGEITVPFLYDHAGPSFSEGLLAVEKDNRWGFIDTSGKEVVPLLYRAVHPIFEEGVAAVEAENKKWGFINTKGEMTAVPQFEDVLTPMSEGLAGVVTADGKAYVRSDGSVAFHADFDQIYPFHDGLAEYREGEVVARLIRPAISIGWGWGGWHRHRHPWIWPMWGPWWYDGWYGETVTETEVKRGYLDKTGRLIAAASLDHVYPASTKGILVFNKGRFGWIAPSGQYVIHTEYRRLIPVEEENLVIARNEDKKWGVLDFRGQVRIPFLYDDVRHLGKGYAALKMDGKWALARQDGTILTKAVYQNIGAEGDGLFPAETRNGWVYLNGEGKETISFHEMPESALFFKDGGAGVKVNGKWGIITKDGTWTAAPVFDAYIAL